MSDGPPPHAISVWLEGAFIRVQIDDLHGGRLPRTESGFKALELLMQDRATSVKKTIGTEAKPTQHDLFKLVERAKIKPTYADAEKRQAIALLDELMGDNDA